MDIWNHSNIENQEDINAAYRQHIGYLINHNPEVVKQLDEIAWAIMDGHDVTLKSMEPHTPRVIGDIIYARINQSAKD